jgi:enoyl-CoA hydratase/carnithine racemase
MFVIVGLLPGDEEVHMPYETINYKRKGKIAYITLNRPLVLNAFNDRMHQDLEAAFTQFDTDEEAWVCVVHGAGKCFSAGGDMKAEFFNQSHKAEVFNSAGNLYESFLLGAVNWKPVIAAVHNYCLGTGFDLALQSDLIVAADDTQFGITEIKRGMPGGSSSAMLHWFMPSKVANEMLLTGEYMSASEFYRLGLVNRLTPDGKHVQAAEELAQKILKVPPLAVRAEVRRNRLPLINKRVEALQYSRSLHLNRTEDFAESTRAFAEKRPPVFHGR